MLYWKIPLTDLYQSKSLEQLKVFKIEKIKWKEKDQLLKI